MKLKFILWAAVALANPLRLDVNVQLDLDESIDKATDPVPENIDARQSYRKLPPVLRTYVGAKQAEALADDQPIVELPYAKHKASPPLTEDQKYYNFSNIPYAQQPIGDLRFKAAKALDDVKGDKPLNDGQTTVVCPQSQAGWVPFAQEFLPQYFNQISKLDDKWQYPITPKDNYTWSEDVPVIPNMDESCLTLDVIVPKRAYDDNYGGLPVMVWFFGGGYIFGSKTLFGSPAGLWDSGNEVEDEAGDFVYVAVNYRLGAFGWLAGDTFEKAGGYENAGLSDQVAALDWVEKNIHLFGGYSGAVTVAGESAGASSILSHLASYGNNFFRRGKPEPKFNRAILQSPAMFPVVDRESMESTYKAFLKEAGAKDFAALQKADTSDLIRANSKTTYESPYGRFNYGPVVDDEYIVIPPQLSLSPIGSIWRKDVMVSWNKDEGALFTPPWVRDSTELRKFMLEAYPSFISDYLDDVINIHYPYDSNLKTAKEKINATSQLMSDFGVRANVHGLRQKTYTYEYRFNVFPGIHGQDANFTYGPSADPSWDAVNVNETMRKAFQRYLVGYINYGDPNALRYNNDTEFEAYNWEGNHMVFGDGKLHLKGLLPPNLTPMPAKDGIWAMEGDLLNKTRCELWQIAPYWDPKDPGVNRHAAQTARLRVQTSEPFEDAHVEI